jgi:hypothetical protein
LKKKQAVQTPVAPVDVWMFRVAVINAGGEYIPLDRCR